MTLGWLVVIIVAPLLFVVVATWAVLKIAIVFVPLSYEIVSA